jgi:chemotaxis family two-component system sensor kinase Cph1
LDFFSHFFAADFMLHSAGLHWLNVVSETLIALSCLVISGALIQFVRKRISCPRRRKAFIWCAAFVIACGMTHFMAVVMLWLPVYELDVLIKAITATVSAISSIVMLRLMLAAPSLPSVSDLNWERVQRSEAEQQRLQLSNQLENLVQERTARIERYNQSLERVAYIASHDLREPLHTVHIYTELLDHSLQGKLEEDEKHLVDFILSGSKRMQALINDLLEYTRVVKTANLGDNRAEPTSLQEAAAGAIAVLEAKIRQSGADIRIEAELPVVLAQLAPLRQVFQNLIGNAIKYRRPEVPSLIHVLAEVSGSTCTVIVRDNGIGIDMRYAASIFEAFKRLHGPDVPGSGVGLALCKSIVESFGGTIWVDSEGPGTGSCFQFALPTSNGIVSDAGAGALARQDIKRP